MKTYLMVGALLLTGCSTPMVCAHVVSHHTISFAVKGEEMAPKVGGEIYGFHQMVQEEQENPYVGLEEAEKNPYAYLCPHGDPMCDVMEEP